MFFNRVYLFIILNIQFTRINSVLTVHGIFIHEFVCRLHGLVDRRTFEAFRTIKFHVALIDDSKDIQF